jgi:DNA-binding transcriptional ArsR family regulator
MNSNAEFAQIAALAGDPARAAMLHALLDGRALTASELAKTAGIAPQTASGHLAQMTVGGLLRVEKQGRHRYHRLASVAVAQMMESIMQVAALVPSTRRLSTGPRDGVMRAARTCYDHLAGQLGVAIADAMVGKGFLELTPDAGLVTAPGVRFLAGIGIDTGKLAGRRGKSTGRMLCRPCLDWSERRPHLAGAVGAAICQHCFDQGLVRRVNGTRGLTITPKGRRLFREQFGARLESIQ